LYRKLAKILAVPTVIIGLGVPALAASASPAHPAAPAVTGSSGYRYAYSYDTGDPAGHPGEQISANFYSQPEAVLDNESHSITQFYIADSANNAVEFGIDTDPSNFGDTGQHIFATTWNAGNFNGYIGEPGYTGEIFHSTSSVKIDSLLADDQWDAFGVTYSATADQVQFYFGNTEIGYIPGGDWPGGGWHGNNQVDVYGESYNNVSGATLPDMNGGVKNFAAGGPTLYDFSIDSPYAIHSTSPAGFTFSGPS
jgi:hypothetical protein